MANTYFTVVTDLGTAKMAEALERGTKLDITAFAVGDGGGGFYSPQAAQTALKNEVWRGAVNACHVSGGHGNTLVIEAVIPADTGGFTVREMGVFDAEGTLVAVCNAPDTRKASLVEGMVHELLLTMELALTNLDSVQLVVDPAVVMATKKDVDDLRAELVQKDSDITARLDTYLGIDDSGDDGSGGIPGLDPGIGATTLVGAVNEVFTLGGERKAGLVAGLTAMGMAASTDDTWDTLLGAVHGIIREWEVQSSGTYGFTHDGRYKWTSNNKGVHSSTAETTWAIDIPSEIPYTVLYRVSSESGCDRLTITLDGTTIVNAISGDGAERGITRTLSAGTHTIKATYTKDGSTNAGQDTGYIILNPVVRDAPVNPGSRTLAGTAAAGDVLSGKTFMNASGAVLSGTMPNNGGTTVDAASVARDDTYTYLGIPAAGYYNTASKVRAANSNLEPEIEVLGTTSGSGRTYNLIAGGYI